jgi:predicted glycosyltransferase
LNIAPSPPLPNPVPPPRVLLYSHDGLGLGHTRRNLAIAGALTDLSPGAAVLVATGIEEITRLGVPESVGILKLPGLRKVANGRYVSRRLPVSAADVFELRSGLLRATVESFRPDVLLADKHPLGAGAELRPALRALRASGGYAVLGLRDILDAPRTVRDEWASHDLLSAISSFYESILIYGCRSVFDLPREYDFPDELAARTEFCGYVVNRIRQVWRATDAPPISALEGRTRPLVLATPGGGEDGYALLERFIQTSEGAPWDAIAVTGPDTPEERRDVLRAMAQDSGVTFRSFVPGLASWFPLVDALVCMGGYNTIAEGLSTGTPMVCVPRSRPRIEQLIRAREFSRIGLLEMLAPEDLRVEPLRRAIYAALRVSRRDLLRRIGPLASFSGARQAAERLLSLARHAQEPASVSGS